MHNKAKTTVLAGMEDAANREKYNLISQPLEIAEKEVANAHTMFNKKVN